MEVQKESTVIVITVNVNMDSGSPATADAKGIKFWRLFYVNGGV